MAIGNAVGSVIANTGLILAISLIAMAGPVIARQFNLKALLLIAACAALWVSCRGGGLTPIGSLVMAFIFLAYIADNIIKTKELVDDAADSASAAAVNKSELPLQLVHFVVGTAGIVIGARLLVDNGSELARLFGVPENIIALTFVAIGTSLPELVTTITAIVKRESSLSVGNIVGANVIDMTMILPACALASGGTLPVGAQSIALDFPAALVISLIALLPPLITHRFYKWQGFLLLAVYAGYLAIMIL